MLTCIIVKSGSVFSSFYCCLTRKTEPKYWFARHFELTSSHYGMIQETLMLGWVGLGWVRGWVLGCFPCLGAGRERGARDYLNQAA